MQPKIFFSWNVLSFVIIRRKYITYFQIFGWVVNFLFTIQKNYVNYYANNG